MFRRVMPESGDDFAEGVDTLLVGTLDDNGGQLTAAADPGPFLFAARPPTAGPGDVVRLEGVGFGDAPGHAAFDWQLGEVQTWTDTVVEAVVPQDAKHPVVRVLTASSAASNGIRLVGPCVCEDSAAVCTDALECCVP